MNSLNPATVRRPLCLLCGAHGESLYRQMRDQLYGVDGNWDMAQCRTCAIAWLDPQPNDFGALYAHYHTHSVHASKNCRARIRRGIERISLVAGKMVLGYRIDAPLPERLVARTFVLFRPSREMAAMRLAGLAAPARGEILDVGCGSGALLAALRDVGWQVTGIEIDEKAVVAARATGVQVHHGTLDSVKLEGGRFAAIVLNHVIEHVADPVGYLRECGRLLAPGGRLIVLTPNFAGLGHFYFRRFWRGLEIPRHLVVFSPAALRSVGQAAGLNIEYSATLLRGARFIYSQSARMRAGRMNIERISGTGIVEKLIRTGGGYVFQCAEWLATSFDPTLGEEIVMHFSVTPQRMID